MEITLRMPARVKLRDLAAGCLLLGLVLLLCAENRVLYRLQATVIAYGLFESAPSVEDGHYPRSPEPNLSTPPALLPTEGPQLQVEGAAPPPPPPAIGAPSEQQLAELAATRAAIDPHRAPLGMDPRHMDCEALMILDDKLPEMPSYPVPTECGLGVIAVGMPRAGSSLEAEVVNQLVSSVATNDRILNMYWDYHKHKRMESIEADSHLAEVRRKLRGMDEAKIVIAKTHEFIPGLLSLCKKTISLSIRRNLRFTSRSIMLSDWVKQDGHEDLIALHKLAIRRRACWLSKANRSLELDYEDFIQSPEKSMQLINQALDLRINKSTLSTIADKSMGKEANQGFPSTKNSELSATQSRTIAHALNSPVVRDWQKFMGYASA